MPGCPSHLPGHGSISDQSPSPKPSPPVEGFPIALGLLCLKCHRLLLNSCAHPVIPVQVGIQEFLSSSQEGCVNLRYLR